MPSNEVENGFQIMLTNRGKALAAVDKSGYLKLKDATDHYLSLRANPAMATDLVYTFPAMAAAGQYLSTDAAGNLVWSAPSSADMQRLAYDADHDGVIDLAAGGTGASTAAGARAALGLGTAATLNIGTSVGNVVSVQAGGKLPLFDLDGQDVDAAIVRRCVERGWAEPWFNNPLKPDWLVCKLTDAGRRAATAP